MEAERKVAFPKKEKTTMTETELQPAQKPAKKVVRTEKKVLPAKKAPTKTQKK